MNRRACRTCTREAAPGSSQCLRCRAGGARRPGSESARRALRRAINRAGSARCAHCRTVHPADLIRVDHVVALADGGRDEPSNVQPLCVGCHRAKTNAENAARVLGMG